MAYLVLLDFLDEAQALSLVQDMLDNPDGAILTPVQENSIYAELKGIYKRPTAVCESGGCGKRPAGFMRGLKWGWWVCSSCRRPSKAYWQNIFADGPFGYNLLDRLFPNTPGESQS